MLDMFRSFRFPPLTSRRARHFRSSSSLDSILGSGIKKICEAIQHAIAERLRAREEAAKRRAKAEQGRSISELSQNADTARAAKQIAARLVARTKKCAEEYGNEHAKALFHVAWAPPRFVPAPAWLTTNRGDPYQRVLKDLLDKLERREQLGRALIGHVGNTWSTRQAAVVATTTHRFVYAVPDFGDATIVSTIAFSSGSSSEVEDWYEREGVLLRKHLLGATFEVRASNERPLKVWAVDAKALKAMRTDWLTYRSGALGLRGEKFRTNRRSQ